MIEDKGLTTVITCDKCKKKQEAPSYRYNDDFFKSKWALNKGRLYEHLCYNCLPKSKKKAMDRISELMKNK